IASGAIDPSYDGTVTFNNIGQGVMAYDDYTSKFYGLNSFEAGNRINVLSLGGAQATGVAVADIISDICRRVGYDVATDIDVSDLAGLEVGGYAVATLSPAVSFIQ